MIRRVAVLALLALAIWFVYQRRRRGSDLAWEDEMPPASDRGYDTAHAAAEPALARNGDVPAESSPAAVAADAAVAPASDLPATRELIVKAHVRGDGAWVYHLPGDPGYEDTPAEQMFASSEEAEAAGYRRAG